MVESCTDYRESQQLLALRKRLSENSLTPKEKEEILRLIEKLEKRLRLA